MSSWASALYFSASSANSLVTFSNGSSSFSGIKNIFPNCSTKPNTASLYAYTPSCNFAATLLRQTIYYGILLQRRLTYISFLIVSFFQLGPTNKCECRLTRYHSSFKEYEHIFITITFFLNSPLRSCPSFSLTSGFGG